MLIALSLFLLYAAATTAQEQGQADEKSALIAESVMKALGGEEAWSKARFIRFTRARGGRYVTLTWDRQTGRFRLDSKDQHGIPFVALMNLNTQQGSVYRNGERLRGAELAEYSKMALGGWAGMTYWFLMPYKLRDPGVILTYEGEEEIGGKIYDTLHLRFEGVGVTPGDQYWAYIDRESHLMERWRYKLQSGAEGNYRWTAWERYRGILLAMERVSDKETFGFGNVLVAEDLPDQIFTDPEKLSLP